MTQESLLVLLANVILITHALFVCFVVIGLVFIYVGYFLNWHWVRKRLFRILHLLAIGIVVTQSWFGISCPLTIWEKVIREKAGMDVYSGSFIQHWLQNLLYYNAPQWVFDILYTSFGILVLVSWYLVRPISHLDK